MDIACTGERTVANHVLLNEERGEVHAYNNNYARAEERITHSLPTAGTESTNPGVFDYLEVG